MTNKELQEIIKATQDEIDRLEKLKPPCGPTERVYWLLGYQRGKLAILEYFKLEALDSNELMI